MIETGEPYGIALPQGSVLVTQLDGLLADGTIDRLERKWVTADLGAVPAAVAAAGLDTAARGRHSPSLFEGRESPRFDARGGQDVEHRRDHSGPASRRHGVAP
jgi:hypothetical protein